MFRRRSGTEKVRTPKREPAATGVQRTRGGRAISERRRIGHRLRAVQHRQTAAVERSGLDADRRAHVFRAHVRVQLSAHRHANVQMARGHRPSGRPAREHRPDQSPNGVARLERVNRNRPERAGVQTSAERRRCRGQGQRRR